MKCPKISSIKNSKCGLANKRIRIITEKKNKEEKKSQDGQLFSRKLFKIIPGSYDILDAGACWTNFANMEEISCSLNRVLQRSVSSPCSVCRIVSGNIIPVVIFSTCRKCPPFCL